jgi:hypothetical protein
VFGVFIKIRQQKSNRNYFLKNISPILKTFFTKENSFTTFIWGACWSKIDPLGLFFTFFLQFFTFEKEKKSVECFFKKVNVTLKTFSIYPTDGFVIFFFFLWKFCQNNKNTDGRRQRNSSSKKVFLVFCFVCVKNNILWFNKQKFNGHFLLFNFTGYSIITLEEKQIWIFQKVCCLIVLVVCVCACVCPELKQKFLSAPPKSDRRSALKKKTNTTRPKIKKKGAQNITK